MKIKETNAMGMRSKKYAVAALAVLLCLAGLTFAQERRRSQRRDRPRTRRTQRVVPMKEVQVASPDGKVKFNANKVDYANDNYGSASGFVPKSLLFTKSIHCGCSLC